MRKLVALVLAFLLFASQAYATGLWVWKSGSWQQEDGLFVWASGSYQAWQKAYVWESGAWQLFYTSSLSVTANNVSGTINNSGNTCPQVFTGDGGGVGSPGTTVSGG